MENTELVTQLSKELAIELPEKISLEALKRQLADYINGLIQHHFEKLVNLLYRIDVNESRIKTLLQQNPDEEAAKIIAALIIERQMEKMNSRQQHFQQNNNSSEEEKW